MARGLGPQREEGNSDQTGLQQQVSDHAYPWSIAGLPPFTQTSGQSVRCLLLTRSCAEQQERQR